MGVLPALAPIALGEDGSTAQGIADNDILVFLTPIGGTTATGGQTVAIEGFTVPNRTVRYEGGQWDVPCVVMGSISGTMTLTFGCTDCDEDGLRGPSTSGIAYLFGGGGLGPYTTIGCIIANAPGVGAPTIIIQEGATRYIGTMNYLVSDCAAGDFVIGFQCTDQGGVCDNDPEFTNSTRYREDDPVNGPSILGPLLSIESFAGTTIHIPVGSCCDGLTCVVDGVGRYCCENGLTNPPVVGGQWFQGGVCGTPSGCGCTNDVDCDDGQFCNGTATCDLGSSTCIPGQPPSCPGSTPCTDGICDPTANNGLGGCVIANKPSGVPCGDPAGLLCDNPDSCDGHGNCSPNFLPEGTPCGIPTNHPACDNTCNGNGTCNFDSDTNGTPCDDDLACTVNDGCVGGSCIGFERDCNDGVLCTFDSCDEAAGGCVHQDVGVMPCSVAANCPSIPDVETFCGAQAVCVCLEIGDCDGDSIPNGSETDPDQRDCDGDNICNGIEIANCPPGNVQCSDCDGNGIPDGCQSDCDQDEIADACEIINCQGGDWTCGDCNSDGRPNICEPDCNNNQLPDGCEIDNCPPGNWTCGDCNDNGVPDGCEGDCNNNQVADGCEIDDCSPGNLFCADCNDNRILDICELGACCYRPFGSPVCFMTQKSGGTSFDPPSSCDNANIWYPGGSTWYGPCRTCDTFQNTIDVVEAGGVIFHHQVGNPAGCPAADHTGGGVVRSCTGTFVDAWKSNASQGTMCHNFGAPGGGPIPSDFFGLGSDALTSVVCLAGVPLGVTQFGDFGEADTLIRRVEDPIDRCSLPSVNPVSIDIEVVALALDNVSPIAVTYNGGQTPEFWDVFVDLSIVTPTPGTLTATKNHCNGGTYTSVLNVQPRFTFTRQSDGLIRTFDTGTEGLSAITLVQDEPAPWVHDVDPNLPITFDACSTFHAGVEESGSQMQCDCNANQLRDLCDIEQGTSDDCNLNLVPDGCEAFLCADDFNPCTDESCETGTGCASIPNTQACSDSNSCTINEACSQGVCRGTRIVIMYADVAPQGGNKVIDVDDILYVLDGFVDQSMFPASDIEPCGGDGDVDVDDIIAMLEAFTGNSFCPDPCPV